MSQNRGEWIEPFKRGLSFAVCVFVCPIPDVLWPEVRDQVHGRKSRKAVGEACS